MKLSHLQASQVTADAKVFPCTRIVLVIMASVAFLLCAETRVTAQDAAAFFKQNCTSCHTIGGGRLTGPDLKDVTTRKDRTWFVQFLQSPKTMIDSGDPYAMKLQQEARGVVMPNIPGMNPQQAQALLDMITAESKLPHSQFAGMQISDRPLTAQDVAKGKLVFLGEQRLSGGGPACISCHTVKGLALLGGGRLGPDLTRVYERLQGRKGLAAWLSSPASPTMSPVFKDHAIQPDEILSLVALFEDSAKRGGQDDTTSLLNFFLLGVGGMVLGLISLDALWKTRFRGVRRSMVHKNDRGEG
ncbi:MAG TPA: c-type cytochrome [Candidatus Dormibacteraeota bacterium]|nr:c-type cytochrome [Candidatus Dormibacteraeota bacterium]